MPKSKGRRYSREVKLAAVKRMLAGENVPLLAEEIGTTRKSLYEWRRSYLAGGAQALRERGLPCGGAVRGRGEGGARGAGLGADPPREGRGRGPFGGGWGAPRPRGQLAR